MSLLRYNVLAVHRPFDEADGVLTTRMGLEEVLMSHGDFINDGIHSGECSKPFLFYLWGG
jgi:hypothetical protein